ncbi:MAG: hypothetical protein Fur0032_11360 [Terrimicrobiaceae bacterium]
MLKISTMISRLLMIGLLTIASVRAAEPLDFTVGDFRFERPAGWAWLQPSSSMRKAHLAVKSEDGSPADVIFFHFGPGQGGSTQANIDRWLAQFQNAKSSTSMVETNGTKVHFVEAEGTFLSGMPGTQPVPLDGFALRGAIIESTGGDVYVKMTGPAPVVTGANKAFRQMVLDAAGRSAH